MDDEPLGFVDHDHDWIPLKDGMKDPRVGGEALAHARQQAIDALLKLMDCHHPRREQCEHTEAIAAFGSAFAATTLDIFVAGVRTGPRPITMAWINGLAAKTQVVTLVSTAGGTR